MNPDVRTIGRNMLVWLVAFVSGIETASSLILSFIRGDVVDAVVWGLATGLIALAAFSIERIKLFLET